jgi:hypothetical protein
VTWDPKITTFPGLYALGAAYAWAARLLAGWAGVGLVRARPRGPAAARGRPRGGGWARNGARRERRLGRTVW